MKIKHLRLLHMLNGSGYASTVSEGFSENDVKKIKDDVKGGKIPDYFDFFSARDEIKKEWKNIKCYCDFVLGNNGTIDLRVGSKFISAYEDYMKNVMDKDIPIETKD